MVKVQHLQEDVFEGDTCGCVVLHKEGPETEGSSIGKEDGARRESKGQPSSKRSLDTFPEEREERKVL